MEYRMIGVPLGTRSSTNEAQFMTRPTAASGELSTPDEYAYTHQQQYRPDWPPKHMAVNALNSSQSYETVSQAWNPHDPAVVAHAQALAKHHQDLIAYFYQYAMQGILAPITDNSQCVARQTAIDLALRQGAHIPGLENVNLVDAGPAFVPQVSNSAFASITDPTQATPLPPSTSSVYHQRPPLPIPAQKSTVFDKQNGQRKLPLTPISTNLVDPQPAGIALQGLSGIPTATRNTWTNPYASAGKKPLPVPPVGSSDIKSQISIPSVSPSLPHSPSVNSSRKLPTPTVVNQENSNGVVEAMSHRRQSSLAPEDVLRYSMSRLALGDDSPGRDSPPPAKSPPNEAELPTVVIGQDDDESSHGHTRSPSITISFASDPSTTAVVSPDAHVSRLEGPTTGRERESGLSLHPRYDPSHPSHELYRPTSTSTILSSNSETGVISCAGCGIQMFGKALLAMNHHWHPDCFKCFEDGCDQLLEHVQFDGKDGKVYCMVHYEELYAAKCYQCKTPIAEEEYIFIDDPSLLPAGPRTYHARDFFCAECGNPFVDPTSLSKGREATLAEPYMVHKGHAYCQRCDVKLFKPKCGGCGKGIAGDLIETLGKLWHAECFGCFSCGKALSGSYLMRDDGPDNGGEKAYCGSCYDVRAKNE